jgi:hypothetical protein
MPLACRLIDKKEDRDVVGFNHMEVKAHIHNRVKSFLKEHSYLYLQIWPALPANFLTLWV